MPRSARLLLIVAVMVINGACGDDEPDPVADGPTTAAREGLTIYFVGPAAADADVLRYEHLVSVTLDREVGDVAEGIRAALHAAAEPTDEQRSDGLLAPLSAAAVPAVIVDGDTVILEWSSTRAAAELAAWGTSSGSSGMNAIVGMVFDNAPEVGAIESRIDGSCETFTLMMQGSGCDRDLRTRWEKYKVSTLPPSGNGELTDDLDSHLGEDWENSVVDALDPRFESSHFSGAGAVGGVLDSGYDGTAPYLNLPPATGNISDGRPGF